MRERWGGTEAEAEATAQSVASDTTTLATPGLAETDALLLLLVFSSETSRSTLGLLLFHHSLIDMCIYVYTCVLVFCSIIHWSVGFKIG